MWIVKLALSRPYTFIVLALLIFVLSQLLILRTLTDIFPNIDILVISVAWTYTGVFCISPQKTPISLPSVGRNEVRPDLDINGFLRSLTHCVSPGCPLLLVVLRAIAYIIVNSRWPIAE
jgi:hypothetical protein